MKSFGTYLEESKNLHMTHLEDAVLDGGVKGTRNVILYLRALRDMLAGNTSAPVSLTTKWDGAPAIFAGIDPTDGKFFVAKKGVFNKNPKLYKSNEDIDNDLSGELNDKFKIALAELSKLGIKGVVQGDFLYTSDDIKAESIDGEPHLTFHPNTIVYAIPVDSGLAKEISRSKIGVVWHTTYGGSDLESMSASFGKKIVPGLKKVASVWNVDAVFEDKSGTATFTAQETKEFTELLSKAGSLFKTTKKGVLDGLYQDAELNMRVNTYINSKIREGSRIGEPKAFVIGLRKFIDEYYEKQAASRSSAKGKQAQRDKKNTVLSYFNKYKDKDIEKVFELYNMLVDAKHIVIDKLNTVQGIKTLLKTSKGFEVTGQEGFVAIDHSGQNVLKLVDRLGFSRANFSPDYIKGWQK